MSDRPCDDLDGWLRLADALDANVASPEVDLELLVHQSRHAAEGLRRLVAVVRGANEPSGAAAIEDEIWMPDGQGGGTRVKVKPRE